MDGVTNFGQAQYVLFHVRDEEYGLPIRRVQSIIRYEEPTPVPRAPLGVDGVFNLRGQVIPLIDLGRLLLRDAFVPGPASRIIVTDSTLGAVGLAVDSVHEVANIEASDIRPAPSAALGAEMAEAFEGVANHGDRLVIMLDIDKALPAPVYLAAGAAAREDGTDV